MAAASGASGTGCTSAGADGDDGTHAVTSNAPIMIKLKIWNHLGLISLLLLLKDGWDYIHTPLSSHEVYGRTFRPYTSCDEKRMHTKLFYISLSVVKEQKTDCSMLGKKIRQIK
jgi:hypothetical protein